MQAISTPKRQPPTSSCRFFKGSARSILLLQIVLCFAAWPVACCGIHDHVVLHMQFLTLLQLVEVLFLQAMPEDTPTQEEYEDEPTSGPANPLNAEIFDNLGNITNPALIIDGVQDLIDPSPNDKLLVNAIPGASIIQFADASHGAIFQHAVTCGEIISAFLND